MPTLNRRYSSNFRFVDVVLAVVVGLIVYDLHMLIVSALVTVVADFLTS